MNQSRPLLSVDLTRVDARLSELWPELDGAQLLLTGGTGFYGHWLLETLLWSVDQRGIALQVDLLSRDPERFRARSPHLAHHPAVRLLKGDIIDFRAPRPYTHVIHGATEANAATLRDQPLALFDSIVTGTRAALEAARPGKARVLLTSSGRIYGPQPPDLTHLPEDHAGGPRPFSSQAGYDEGKRAAETLGAIAAHSWDLPVIAARGFAFVGPHLPLDRHFAIGNFLADALAGRPIHVAGDGTPWRSYMYAADLAVWLWTLLLRGTPGVAYNVGSEQALTIRETAELVGAEVNQPVTLAQTPAPGQPASRYVPATERARRTLGLGEEVDLRTAIRRTLEWHRGQANPALREDASTATRPAGMA